MANGHSSGAPCASGDAPHPRLPFVPEPPGRQGLTVGRPPWERMGNCRWPKNQARGLRSNQCSGTQPRRRPERA